MMKKLITIIVLAVFAITTVTAQRTYALIVGVSKYENSANDLAQTTKDAKAFKKVLDHHTKDISIITSSYATKQKIKENLSAICNRAGSQDRIIFYFSGHGTPGGIAAHDGVIWYDELSEIMKQTSAKELYCFIDACHAGTVLAAREFDDPYAAFRSVNKKGTTSVFFVACRSDEYSFENPWIGKGFFTQALLKGIRGKSDADGDKKISVMELFTFIYNDVQKSTKMHQQSQHPQLIAPKSSYDNIIVAW